MIEHYSFGELTVDGETHENDLIIFPDGRVEGNWWRRQGHALCEEDISELIESKPDLIIAGTGAQGVMNPDEGSGEILKNHGIEFKPMPTGEAVDLYNKLSGEKRVGACFHLTC